MKAQHWGVGLLAGLISLGSSAASTVEYSECKQSFDYLGTTYYGTTDRNNSGKQWCYLKTLIDGQNWANVNESSIPLQQTSSGKSCKQITEYAGEKVHGCTSRGHSQAWCYLEDKSWENCQAPQQEPLLSHTQPNSNSRLDEIAVGSCFKVQGTMSQTMTRLINQQPDLFLWLGDNIYADTTDMSVMRKKYDDKKRNPDYQAFLQANIPVMATWDDHDFGANNEGKYYSKRTESQQEFLRHYDIDPSDPRFGQQAGIYSAEMFGNGKETVHVIMLDARYFRSPTFSNYGSCEGDTSTILGIEQWQWLQQELDKPSTIKVIASGIQVLPPIHRGRNLSAYCAYGSGNNFNQAIANLNETEQSGTSYESWAEMPIEREKLLRMIQRSVNQGKTKQVVFTSGDQHWGELLQKEIPASESHGNAVTVYEVTASGFGQNWPYSVPNPNRLPVWADTKGNGSYDKTCKLPFKYAGVTYKGCTTRDNDSPWCYTEVDASGAGVAGEWGNCAPENAEIPTGIVGKISSNIASLTTDDRHLINRSGSNYGKISIDWNKRLIKLSIETESEEAIATLIKF